MKIKRGNKTIKQIRNSVALKSAKEIPFFWVILLLIVTWLVSLHPRLGGHF